MQLKEVFVIQEVPSFRCSHHMHLWSVFLSSGCALSPNVHILQPQVVWPIRCPTISDPEDFVTALIDIAHVVFLEKDYRS